MNIHEKLIAVELVKNRLLPKIVLSDYQYSLLESSRIKIFIHPTEKKKILKAHGQLKDMIADDLNVSWDRIKWKSN